MSKPKIATVLSLIVTLIGIAFTTAASARDDLATSEYYGRSSCRRVRVCYSTGYCGWRTVCRFYAAEQDADVAAFDDESADDGEEAPKQEEVKLFESSF